MNLHRVGQDEDNASLKKVKKLKKDLNELKVELNNNRDTSNKDLNEAIAAMTMQFKLEKMRLDVFIEKSNLVMHLHG
jgi:DNA repair ATPase RecN